MKHEICDGPKKSPNALPKGRRIQERGKQLASVVQPSMLTEKPESEVRSMWVKVSKVTYVIINMNGREIPLELPIRRWVLPEETRKKACFKSLRYCYFWSWHNLACLVAQLVKNPPAMQETWVRSLGWENPLKEGMATHSRILAWRIPMDRRAWQATVHVVAKNWTQLSTAGLSELNYSSRSSIQEYSSEVYVYEL